LLEAWLEFHRTTLFLKCEGLDEKRLKTRPLPTSKLSLHGIVRHMAEVERNWFRRVLERDAATPYLWRTETNDKADLTPREDADWQDDRATLEQECAASRPGRFGTRSRRHRRPARSSLLAALDLRPPDRGIRPP
jgi:uncharacterized damage-inducible protein DinB